MPTAFFVHSVDLSILPFPEPTMSLFLLKLYKERQERIVPTGLGSGLMEIIPAGEEYRVFFKGQVYYLELVGIAQAIWPHIQKESFVFRVSRVKINQKKGILTIKEGCEVSRVQPWHSEESHLFEKIVTVHDLWKLENGVRAHWITEHEKRELAENRYYVKCQIGSISNNYGYNLHKLCGGCRKKKPVEIGGNFYCACGHMGEPYIFLTIALQVSDLEEGLRPYINVEICEQEAEKLVGMTAGELDQLHSTGSALDKYDSLVEKTIVLRLKGLIPSNVSTPFHHNLVFLGDKVFF